MSLVILHEWLQQTSSDLLWALYLRCLACSFCITGGVLFTLQQPHTYSEIFFFFFSTSKYFILFLSIHLSPQLFWQVCQRTDLFVFLSFLVKTSSFSVYFHFLVILLVRSVNSWDVGISKISYSICIASSFLTDISSVNHFFNWF